MGLSVERAYLSGPPLIFLFWFPRCSEVCLIWTLHAHVLGENGVIMAHLSVWLPTPSAIALPGDVDDPSQKGSAGKLALRLLNEVSSRLWR